MPPSPHPPTPPPRSDTQPPPSSTSTPLPQPQPHAAQPSTPIPASAPTADPDLYEATHVHGVYSQIAPHFSATRHKPWPLIARFLVSQPPGSLGLDVGCGNGKYLGVNRDVYLVGCDRSGELVRLARTGEDVGGGGGHAGGGDDARGKEEEGTGGGGKRWGRNEVLTADGLALPFAEGRADFAICVAVVHHFSTKERRVEAVRALLRCVRPTRKGETGAGGKVMVFVWALEQKGSRRGWDEGAEQDQLVPWVMKPRQQKKKKEEEKSNEEGGDGERERDDKKEEEKTFQRYYHLYRKGELEEDVVAAGGVVLESGYDRDNWWVIAANIIS